MNWLEALFNTPENQERMRNRKLVTGDEYTDVADNPENTENPDLPHPGGPPQYDENTVHGAPLPITAPEPLTVVIHRAIETIPRRPNENVTGDIALNDTVVRQILGDDEHRHSAAIRNSNASGGDNLILYSSSSGVAGITIPPGESYVTESRAAWYGSCEASQESVVVEFAIERYNPEIDTV